MSIKLSTELSLELNSPERVKVLAVSNITQTEAEISWEKATNSGSESENSTAIFFTTL